MLLAKQVVIERDKKAPTVTTVLSEVDLCPMLTTAAKYQPPSQTLDKKTLPKVDHRRRLLLILNSILGLY